MNMRIQTPHSLLGIELVHLAAASAAPVSNSRHGQETQSMNIIRPAVVTAELVHRAAVVHMTRHMRGIAPGVAAKASVQRRLATLARACRLYLSVERLVLDGPARPKGFRCDDLLGNVLPKISEMLVKSGVTTAKQDLPGPHGFRRALREYERARSHAAKSLSFDNN